MKNYKNSIMYRYFEYIFLKCISNPIIVLIHSNKRVKVSMS